MSRIGKLPVAIPDKVKATVDGQTVSIEGAKGKLSQTFDNGAAIKLEDNIITVTPANNSRHARAVYGTVRAIIQNMVVGVVDGYTKDLEISGVGFKAQLQGKIINLQLGFSHDINYEIPEGVNVTVADGTKVKVEGADKKMVGQVAADIRSFAPAEPYKGKGVKFAGERIRRKEGKKSA